MRQQHCGLKRQWCILHPDICPVAPKDSQVAAVRERCACWYYHMHNCLVSMRSCTRRSEVKVTSTG